MNDCNATLTTCTVTDDVVAKVRCTDEADPEGHFHGAAIPDGVAVVRKGDRLLRLDVTTLTCERSPVAQACKRGSHRQGWVLWTDDTEGAMPHTPPADVCPNPDCEGGSVPNPSAPTAQLLRLPCPSCGGTGMVKGADYVEDPAAHRCDECRGTGDRPDVTDAEWDAAVRAYSANGVDDDTAERFMAALEARNEVYRPGSVKISIKLYKNVVTDRKVSFIEMQSYDDLSNKVPPMTLTMSKTEWLKNERPETMEVRIL